MATGKFVWFELLTTDVDAAKAFYTEVIGWKTQKMDGPMDYTVWSVGERGVGGLMTLPEPAKAAGAPPHWLGHVEVPDADATAKQATELGGNILVPVQEMPDVGRFALIQDPQGAVLSVYTPANPMEGGGTGSGDFTWNELNTTDYEAAWTFYSELFGWQATESFDMGPEHGTYFMFKRDGGERTLGGMSNAANAEHIHTHWLYYITVDDIAAAVERVKSNGGKLVNGPMEVPGGELVAQCEDPQGAAFALHQPAKQ